MSSIASQITSLTIVYSTGYSGADQRKHQSSASLAFAWGIHRDRWIPRTKGQLRGKCFHLMTSSWRTSKTPNRADIITKTYRVLSVNRRLEQCGNAVIQRSGILAPDNSIYALIYENGLNSATEFLYDFSWKKVYWIQFHLCFFLRVQLTVFILKLW